MGLYIKAGNQERNPSTYQAEVDTVEGSIIDAKIAGRDVVEWNIDELILEVDVSSGLDTIERERRKSLLSRIRTLWLSNDRIANLNEPSHHSKDLRVRNDLIGNPWTGIVKDVYVTLSWKSLIAEIRDRSTSLLIVGHPGSGKTTTLLQLLQYASPRIREDGDGTIPIPLSLSLWSKQKSFEDWLVHILHSRYVIPEEWTWNWLEKQQISLFLDDLDQVQPAKVRASCIERLNEFYIEYGLGIPIIVCSEISAYQTVNVRLQLERAIQVAY